MAKKSAAPASTGDAARDLLILQAARFSELFVGNTRSSGRFDPMKERMFTEYQGARQEDFERHLLGTMGVGVVPIMDDDTCQWGAIDIDNHGSDEDIPIGEIDDRITVGKLPLIACRSKSGGVHVYVFLDKPHPAAKIRTYMTAWALNIGYGGSEIFPKQAKLVYGKDQQKALGNWLNLPYMGGDQTIRYGFRGGKKLSMAEFLDLAEKMRQSEHDLRSFSSSEHPEAPPCVQKMFAQGVAQGHRNEALYNIVVYYKKAYPDGYEAKAVSANQAVFSKPLARAEMQRTIGSAGKPECGYRCNEEPVRSLCDRDTCLTRKFGITPADRQRLDTVDALPVFSNLTKYISDPVRWEFQIDGIRISNVGTPSLLDWRMVREIIADRLTRIVPLIKNSEWERILQPLMTTARIVEAPDDASISGLIRARLREFAAKADLHSKGEDAEDRKALLRGLPVVVLHGGDRYVAFRNEDFVSYLKRTRSEELKGVNLWFAVKEIGVTTFRVRIPGARSGENNINVWGLPVKEILQIDVGAATFKSDL